MIVLAAAVLVTFAGVLWFISHHKKEETPVIPNHKANGNGLPPKPEERWKYIKELENRQITVPSPTEPSAGGEIQSQTQLTDEQRQLLEQMQADMRQQPTQLNEVPWNEQTPAQRQHTLQHQQQLQQQRQQQLQQQATHQQQAAPITRESAQPPKAQETAKAKTEDKAPPQRWMVQCGSFKGTEQAESVRAALAFEGFESHITTGSGWNRVVIGPFKNRNSADNTVKRLHSSGHGNCILLALP